jgi:hypothetical protein
MLLSNNEMAPRERQLPGTRPTERTDTVDDQRLAQASSDRHDQDHEPPHCCIDGWVYLGYEEDGEERIEPVRCLRCAEPRL